MGFYEKYVLPKLLNAVMKTPDMTRIRRELVPRLQGHVLEVGIGSGLNLPFYNGASKVTGIDPSEELQVYAREVAERSNVDVEFVTESSEVMPFENQSFDSVLVTWTLCTIPNAELALQEIRRVLKPGGQLFFAEHGLSPDPEVVRWQDRLNGIWGKVAGGCNLNRDTVKQLADAGFQIDDLEQGYIPGPRFATFQSRGVASAR